VQTDHTQEAEQAQAQTPTEPLAQPGLESGTTRQPQVGLQPKPAAEEGNCSLLEALMSRNLGHLHSVLTAEGLEIKNMSELRNLASYFSRKEFFDTMEKKGVTRINDRIELHKLSS